MNEVNNKAKELIKATFEQIYKETGLMIEGVKLEWIRGSMHTQPETKVGYVKCKGTFSL